jgi:hypothetical protein
MESSINMTEQQNCFDVHRIRQDCLVRNERVVNTILAIQAAKKVSEQESFSKMTDSANQGGQSVETGELQQLEYLNQPEIQSVHMYLNEYDMVTAKDPIHNQKLSAEIKLLMDYRGM